MKKFFLVFLLLVLPISLYGQQPWFQRVFVNNGTAALPSFTFGSNQNTGIYRAAANQIGFAVNGANVFTLTAAGFAGAYSPTQGVLTASAPFINHTATWNNGAVTFQNILSNITNTASAGASTLIDLQVGGVSQFQVSPAGWLTLTGGAYVGATSQIYFTGRSRILSSNFALLSLQNSTGTDFTRLTLGPEAVTNPGIAVSAAVGGQTQGIIILRGDGTTQVFASLGAATNGSMIYCSDCTIASPCAGAGSGAIAKRLNGVWICN